MIELKPVKQLFRLDLRHCHLATDCYWWQIMPWHSTILASWGSSSPKKPGYTWVWGAVEFGRLFKSWNDSCTASGFIYCSDCKPNAVITSLMDNFVANLESSGERSTSPKGKAKGKMTKERRRRRRGPSHLGQRALMLIAALQQLHINS